MQDATLSQDQIAALADAYGMTPDDVADVVQQADTSDRGRRRHLLLLHLAVAVQSQAAN